MQGVCAVCGKSGPTYWCDFCQEDIGYCCQYRADLRAWQAARKATKQFKGVVAQLLGKAS